MTELQRIRENQEQDGITGIKSESGTGRNYKEKRDTGTGQKYRY